MILYADFTLLVAAKIG